MTRCGPPDCACDCHVPPRPAPEQIASPELVALRLREAREQLRHNAEKRQQGERMSIPRCPYCGRGIGFNTDGVRRSHRVKDDPLAPRCPESGRKEQP